jgi:superfamily II DNA helicase RecQ
MPNLKDTLQSVFGLEDFRPMQEDICQAVIQSMSQLRPLEAACRDTSTQV